MEDTNHNSQSENDREKMKEEMTIFHYHIEEEDDDENKTLESPHVSYQRTCSPVFSDDDDDDQEEEDNYDDVEASKNVMRNEYGYHHNYDYASDGENGEDDKKHDYIEDEDSSTEASGKVGHQNEEPLSLQCNINNNSHVILHSTKENTGAFVCNSSSETRKSNKGARRLPTSHASPLVASRTLASNEPKGNLLPAVSNVPIVSPNINDIYLQGYAAGAKHSAMMKNYHCDDHDEDEIMMGKKDEEHCVDRTTSRIFPVILHQILSSPEYSELIAWLPHGRSWCILKPKAFEQEVIPHFFRHSKYSSFMRQVNGWGFQRITAGPDLNSYYHEHFLRGLPELCERMRRRSKTNVFEHHETKNPDFHLLSLMAPLPDPDNGNQTKKLRANVPDSGAQQSTSFSSPFGAVNADAAVLSGLSSEIAQLDALRSRNNEICLQLQGLNSSPILTNQSLLHTPVLQHTLLGLDTHNQIGLLGHNHLAGRIGVTNSLLSSLSEINQYQLLLQQQQLLLSSIEPNLLGVSSGINHYDNQLMQSSNQNINQQLQLQRRQQLQEKARIPKGKRKKNQYKKNLYK